MLKPWWHRGYYAPASNDRYEKSSEAMFGVDGLALAGLCICS
jgi:hypothetical protein